MAPARHQRRSPLLQLLIRLGWQRDPELWTVRCHDRYGRRALVQVHVTEIGVGITLSSPETMELTPTEAGRLRVALRDSALSCGELAGPDGFRDPARASRRTPPSQRPASTRELVRIHRPPRPTVAEITTRLAQPHTLSRETTNAAGARRRARLNLGEGPPRVSPAESAGSGR